MALSARTHKPLPSQAAEYRDIPPTGMRLGIALSGGGIRSAAFNLGALQALQERHVLDHADYLTAVSGGNYIASALTISGANHKPEYDNGKPAWAHGSVEERYLRQHTNYLAPGAKGRVWLGLNICFGFILNYLPFLLCAFVAGRVIGWLLHGVLGLKLAGLRLDGLELWPSGMLTAMLGSTAACVLAAISLVGYRRFKDGQRDRPADYGQTRSEGLAYSLIKLAVVLVGVGWVLPLLAGLYGSASTFVLSTVLARPMAPENMGSRVSIAAFWLLVSLLLAAVALGLSRRFRARRLMLVLASLAAVGLLVVPLLSSLEYAVRHGLHSADDVLPVALAMVVVLYMAIRVHNRRYSLHLFYRERLNSAFALRRTKDKTGTVVADPIPYDEPLDFSEIESNRKLPKLIVCCAVNLTSDEVPVGRFAESFTFEHDLSGGRLFGYHKTDCFESGSVTGTNLTLPSIMAVSGAALSPLMGRFTYRPLRFLMAMTNIRLGVWIRNPRHRDWNPDSGRDSVQTAPAGRIARRATPRRVAERLLGASLTETIINGWYEPGALYVLREALGATKSSHRFIYLTDGGHWENLGLVELLRRRCTHVLCFDASGDAGSGLGDIGRAIALARSELGVDIEIDPRPTMPAKRFSDDVAVRGLIKYPDPGQEARLVYARAVLTEQSSWDLLAYQARDGQFPNHSTSQQIFTDEQFESYRALGYQAGCRALKLLNIPEVLLHSHAPAGIASPDGASPDSAASLGSIGNGRVDQPRGDVPASATAGEPI